MKDIKSYFAAPKKGTPVSKKPAQEVVKENEKQIVSEKVKEEMKDKEKEKPPVKATKTAKKANVKTEPKEPEEKVPDKKKSGFRAMITREAPKALGSRPLPVGKSNCLTGYTFVISGEMETMTKDTVIDLIKRYGGRVTGAVSGKTTFLVKGRDAGEKKTNDAKKHNTKILDEDAFYKLIETEDAKDIDMGLPKEKASASKEKGKAATNKADTGKSAAITSSSPSSSQTDQPASELWTVKYRPKSLNEILGNKEMVKKISSWLENWESNKAAGFPATSDPMSSYRAVLISGPPGIGKTTTASLVAETHGYQALEFNASDVRSKNVLREHTGEMVDNRSMTEFFHGDSDKQSTTPTKGKTLLIMDEVDGMTGGDRGGSGELAALIRKTKIPVICICNDVRSTKVQPLLRVCFDARFKRTPAAQLRSRIMTIAYREKLQLQPNAIDELVQITGNDIRQIINILSTYRLSENSMTYDQAKAFGKSNEKNAQVSLFDIPGLLLSASSWRSMSLPEKSDVYFQDYSLAPLMVFENYLKSTPEKAQQMSQTGNPREIACNEMQLAADAAEAMSEGDLVDSVIHGSIQQYSLMPVHSIFSCVLPASFMEGSLAGNRLGFPSWLGQNSKGMKNSRLLDDIRYRMRLKSTANSSEVRQNYMPTLSARLFDLLKEENFTEAIALMDAYHLDRENVDTLNDLDLSPKKPMTQLSAKTKTTFTRMYNAEAHPNPFSVGGATITKSTVVPVDDFEEGVREDDTAEVVSDNEDEDELTSDKLVKNPKKRKSNTASGSRETKRAKK